MPISSSQGANVKISEPAAVEQECVVPSELFARRLGYACLIFFTLASRDAIAQTTISVTLNSSETTKTIQAPRDLSFNVSYVTPPHVCNLPSAAAINARYSDLVTRGLLRQVLTQMEATSLGSAVGTSGALGTFLGLPASSLLYMGNVQSFSQAQLSGGQFTHSFATACLTLLEAQTLLYEIRRSMRADLGMSAPTAIGASQQ